MMDDTWYQYEILESIIANKVASSGFLDSLSVKLKLILHDFSYIIERRNIRHDSLHVHAL